MPKSVHPSSAPMTTAPSDSPPGAGDTRLIPAYLFEEFVVGPHNRFPHAAALAVSENLGKAYNPLFIYGPVGIGKTHLMQAVGHRVLQRNPATRVLYVTAQQFMTEVIELLQAGKLQNLRDRYRSLDLLLVDDIQFLATSEATQEEFFHMFNDLHAAGKQIIMTSDRPPKMLTTLEDRLRSRFEWGLIADIKLTNLETRVAILKKKEIHLKGLHLADDIRLYIASRLKSNIRELEGFLRRIQAYTQLNNQDISLPLVKEILKELLPPEEWTEDIAAAEPAAPPPDQSPSAPETVEPVADLAPAESPPEASLSEPETPEVSLPDAAAPAPVEEPPIEVAPVLEEPEQPPPPQAPRLPDMGDMGDALGVPSKPEPSAPPPSIVHPVKAPSPSPTPTAPKPTIRPPMSIPMPNTPSAPMPIPTTAAKPAPKPPPPPIMPTMRPAPPPLPGSGPAVPGLAKPTPSMPQPPPKALPPLQMPPAKVAGPTTASIPTTGSAIPVVFFYPAGREKELEQMRKKFEDIIKKHKLKFTLQSALEVSFPVDPSLDYESFAMKCAEAGVNIAVVLGPPNDGPIQETEFFNQLQDVFEKNHVSLQMVPWDELGKDYRFLNLALDITLIRIKQRKA